MKIHQKKNCEAEKIERAKLWRGNVRRNEKSITFSKKKNFVWGAKLVDGKIENFNLKMVDYYGWKGCGYKIIKEL